LKQFLKSLSLLRILFIQLVVFLGQLTGVLLQSFEFGIKKTVAVLDVGQLSFLLAELSLKFEDRSLLFKEHSL